MHPDSINTRDGFPVGSNSYNSLLAAADGTNPYHTTGFPDDACLNPWKYVRDGAYAGADDIQEATGTRPSIMEALTAHNPKVCLTADDLEGLNTIYPVCTGRDMTMTTGKDWNCGKSDHNIGFVRVAVWIVLPVAAIMLIELLILSRLKSHEEEKMKKKDVQLADVQLVAKQHKENANAANEEALVLQQTLEVQKATEEQRIEERAQELAASRIHTRRS